jgi:hypothetical protein
MESRQKREKHSFDVSDTPWYIHAGIQSTGQKGEVLEDSASEETAALLAS